jgi:isoquinoline 1-oxidoreductase beta subunit
MVILRAYARVIELVAEKSGWGKQLPKGHGMGICAHKSFLTYVACVVHVAFDDSGKLSIPLKRHTMLWIVAR